MLYKQNNWNDLGLIMKKNIVLIFILTSFFLLPGTYSQTIEDASNTLNISEQHIREMLDMGFGVERVNDLLTEAKEIFRAQKALEEAGGSPDYSLITDKTDKIRDLKNKAFNVNDEITALEIRIQELEGINTTEITSLLEQAKEEFENERYDQSKVKIEEAYEKISEEQALSIRVVAFFDATRKGILNFIAINWQILLTALIILVIIAIFFKNEISRYLIKREIRRLDMEKKVILGLIKKLQRQYFELGTVPEVSYTSKLVKFEELIRDINRRIPLLKADLESTRSMLKIFRKK